MSGQSIPDLIAARAAESPDLVAIEHGAEQLTFAELERRSSAAAGRLRRLGVRPDALVAVCLTHSAAMVVNLLGILKAGGGYVALDPAYPAARLRWILGDVRPAVTLVSQVLRNMVPSGDIPVVLAEDLNDGIKESAGRAPLPAGDPGRLAFITYTSGTTGRPKGVMAVHGSLTYFMGTIARYLGFGPGTRFLQFYPLTWETQVLDIYAVLAAGGTVIVPPPDVETAGPSLVEFLCAARVTGAMLPPALLAELNEEPPLPELHTLAYIGEPCAPQVAERWGRGRRLVNLYGPTEVTVAATASDERRPDQAPPIGKPLEGRRVYVLDAGLRPVPDGKPGELCVGGRGLAHGYWGLPELTEKQFPADPFSDQPGARMYRTGDRVRRLPDGNLDFLGRVDDQLNFRGQRVERGEVEAVLAAHPGVRSCAVVVHGEGAGARLVAFVTGTPEIAAELPSRLAAQLPPIMVPSAVVRLDKLPLNQHGKIDLKRLAELPVENARPSGPITPPAAGVAAGLARIWRDVLSVAEVSATDGFRALGGTSLQVVRVLNRIRERFGTALTVRELLSAATLAELADLVSAGGGDRAALPPLTRTDAGERHLASLHQRRVWTLTRMKRAASIAYNEPSALWLSGRLDLPALRQAVQDLVNRHDAFRSSFRLAGGELVVDVADHVAAGLEAEDLTGGPDPRGQAARRAAALGAEPFDLAKAPLLRAVLLVTGASEWVLVLITHHIVADGPSLDVMDRDLSHCYAARLAGRSPDPLPDGRLRPRDHAAWQHSTAGCPALVAGLDRWRALLAGAPAELRLPADVPRPASFTHRGARVNSGTGAQLRQAVTALAREAGTTPYAVCLLALAVLVGRHTGQHDLLIGSPYAGRPSDEADDVVGFFTNTVAMRVSFGDDPVPLRLLKAIDAYVQEALEHQYVDFSAVVRAVGARPGAAGQPLVQVVLAYQGPLRPMAGLAGTRHEPWLVDNGTVKADLTVEVNEVGHELLVVLPYSADILRPATAERLLSEYLDILCELTTAPDQPVRLTAGLSAFEGLPALKGGLFHVDLSALLARTLGRGGSQTALQAGAQTWSYAELDRITRDRAAVLRGLVPAPGRVALMGEHTAEALIWALAVMRAGLAYTPVNLGLPAERKREALDVAAPGIVLCSSADAAATVRREGIAHVVMTKELAVGGQGEAPASWPAHQVAYSIFTSGSSGLPKLVNVGHRGIENLCRAQARLFGVTPGTRVLQFSSLAFDASISELLVTLYAGATLVVPVSDGGSWVHAVGRHLRDHPCDLVTLPPSVYARLDDDARRGIRTLVFAGEALSEAEFRAAAGHSRVLNAYGPTEGTVCFSVAELTRFSHSVGWPIDGYAARVYHPGRDSYEEAGRGELVLVGDGVALGYHGRSPDPGGPFTTVDGQPAYHTGDEVELCDGEVFYLGRLDDQIKRLGHRIGLTALEGRLSRMLGSRVAVLTDGGSVVLAHTRADEPERELRRRLREELPAWEVPDVLLAVTEIPVTDAGKADRNSLRELARHGARDVIAEAAAGDDLEAVSGIVTKILGIEIDPATSIFEAGGTSFTLVQIQVELAELFGEVPVQEAFDQLNYDFAVEGFVAALRGRPQQDASAGQKAFDAVAADLSAFRAELGALRSGRPVRDAAPGQLTVTGAGGFIGGHILDRVLGTGRPITIVTTGSPECLIERHCARFVRQSADFADVRFLGYDDLDTLAENADPWGAVVHCGFEVNHLLPLDRHLAGSVSTTRTLLRAAASRRAHRIAFLSAASIGTRFLPFTADTLAAVGDPYSQAKFIAEAYAEAVDGDACRVDLLRTGLVYGHGARDRQFLEHDVFASLLRLSARHGMLPRLRGLVPVCHVADVADATLAASAAGGAPGQRSVLVQRTYDLDAVRDELGLGEVRLVDPQTWLTTITEAATADPRILSALRLWLEEAGWTEPIQTTDRPIIKELQVA